MNFYKNQYILLFFYITILFQIKNLLYYIFLLTKVLIYLIYMHLLMHHMRYIFHSNNHKNIYLYLLQGNDNLKTEGSVGLSLRRGNDMAALHFDFRRYKKNNWILYFPSYHNNVDFSFNDATTNMRFDISTFWSKNKTQIKHFSFWVEAEIPTFCRKLLNQIITTSQFPPELLLYF